MAWFRPEALSFLRFRHLGGLDEGDSSDLTLRSLHGVHIGTASGGPLDTGGSGTLHSRLRRVDVAAFFQTWGSWPWST